MENSNSKHGYQRKIIIRYGEIDVFSEAKFIKNIPVKIDKRYDPESPK